jgi:hypothetical protein
MIGRVGEHLYVCILLQWARPRRDTVGNSLSGYGVGMHWAGRQGKVKVCTVEEAAE